MTLRRLFSPLFTLMSLDLVECVSRANARNKKPPAMRVVSKNVIQNNHHSFYNEGVQAIKIRKNGDYNG